MEILSFKKNDYLKYLFIIVCLSMSLSVYPEIVSYPIPLNEPKYETCQLQINGSPVDIYACRVSKFPINQVWPGYQRPIEQTELAGFAYWDMKGKVNVEITTMQPSKKIVIRPLSLGIKANVETNKISFKLDSIIPLVVEMDGYHNTLHLFPNKVQDNIIFTKSNVCCCPQCNYCSPQLNNLPDNKNSHLYYFGPGLHDIGTMQLKSNDSVYIAGGAVVYGSFTADNADNIYIWGRGILDGSHIQRADKWGRAGYGCIHFRNSSNITIRGIILRDPNSWGCTIRRCQEVDILNLKMIGFWRYNADGIDIWDSYNVSVKNCFIRSYDDALVVRETGGNINFDRCVLWNDWGISLEIYTYTRGEDPTVKDVIYKNIDIIRASTCAMRIRNSGASVQNIKYENINVEFDEWIPRPKFQQTRGELYVSNSVDNYSPSLFQAYMTTPLKSVNNIIYKNVKVVGNTNTESLFSGKDSKCAISNVLIKNLVFNNTVVTDFKEANINVGEFVNNIKIEK